MKKRIVVDGQILQTGAWHRGMGKYTLQLLKEMSRHASNDTVVFYLMLNDKLGLDNERIKTIQYLCPELQLLQLDLPLPVKRQTPEAVAQYVRELDKQLAMELPQGDFEFFMTSLFFFDFFAEFPTKAYRSLLFYDLTPLLFWRDLGGYFPPELYMGRFRQILEAQKIYSISETTKNDLMVTFGIDGDSVININGGFSRIAEKTAKPTSFAVPKKYILLPTGDLPHKNNDVAVAGFEDYASKSPDPVKLLITSHFSDTSKRRLNAISPNVVFTENVNDEELEWLYENASAVMFASKYEGLGIPILDAVANNKPIITSNIPVFKEMSTNLFYYFDPESAIDLSGQISFALDGNDFARRQTGYAEILERYSWSRTFDHLWKSMRKTSEVTQLPAYGTDLPRLAIACLHPGIKDQIGRQVESLHASLNGHYIVDYFFDANGHHYREMERPSYLDFLAHKTYDIGALDLSRYRQYDAVLFVVDEHALPSRLMQRAVVLPGMVLCPSRIAHNETVAWKLISRSQIVRALDGSLFQCSKQIRQDIDGNIERFNDYRQVSGAFTPIRTAIERLYSIGHDK